MKVKRSASRLLLRASIAGALVCGIVGSAAAAATANFSIRNSSGQRLTLTQASCTSGSISAPSSISSGSSASFSGTTTGTTTLCTVRYTTPLSAGNKGCQFQVQVTQTSGFASANAYQGSPAPTCVGSGSGSGGTYSGSFGQSN